MAAAPLSPLAPKTFPALPRIEGVRFATIAAGVRYSGRTDVMMALFDRPAAVAGVFTRSKCPSAPVDWCRRHLAGGRARALIVNSGNANAFTGGVGAAAVAHVAEAAAHAIGAPSSEIFMASTGVIGEPLDGARITRVIDTLAAQAREDGLLAAAKAIMTTDTYPKVATARVKLGEGEVVINGIAKGAGMIAPDMATMLAYVFTDAAVAPGALQAMLSKSVEALVQRDHRRQRHLDLRHADDFRHRRGGARVADRGRRRSARRLLQARPRQAPASISRIRWCATARARASSSP